MKDLPDALADAPATWLGNTFRTVLPASATGGAMTVIDNAVPAGFGPPRHVHAREDEAFVVLEGEIELWVAGASRVVRAGQAGFAPRGTEHAFRALTETRMLVILTPSGFEGFFADMAAGAFRIPEDMGPIEESAARHGLAFTGPPL